MTYCDTNFFTNLLVDMPQREEAERLLSSSVAGFPVTWLHRWEVLNALQQCIYLTRQGTQELRVTRELAAVAEAEFFDELKTGKMWFAAELALDRVDVLFQTLSYRHTSSEGFRTYDLLHVSSAIAMECDTFWSFDRKAKRLASLEGLRVN